MLLKNWILGGLLIMMQMGHSDAKAPIHEDTVHIFNAGYNGNNTADLLERMDKDVISHAPGLVVMMVGTNDMLNERNMLSIDSFSINYEHLIKLLKRKSALVLMTIPPVNSGYIAARDPKFAPHPDAPQKKVDAANALIRGLAKRYHCTLIDLDAVLTGGGGSGTNRESLFQNEANSGIADGVHPTYDGYRVIAAAVFQTIRLKWPDVHRVVCFGDSITFGYRMQGGGTSTGQCYPGILQAMFDHRKTTRVTKLR